MTFFVGTPDGRGSHDDIAAKLAAQGKEWARLHWRKEDMASYMYRLVLGEFQLSTLVTLKNQALWLTSLFVLDRVDSLTTSRRRR